MATKLPPLSEFIDLGQRRAESRAAHGFPAMHDAVTVAVYNTIAGYQTLTIRISDDLAEKYGLIVGARMACHVHPDQQHIALTPGVDGGGAALLRPKRTSGKGYRGRALTYQTTLRNGTLDPQPATKATMKKVENALVISMT